MQLEEIQNQFKEDMTEFFTKLKDRDKGNKTKFKETMLWYTIGGIVGKYQEKHKLDTMSTNSLFNEASTAISKFLNENRQERDVLYPSEKRLIEAQINHTICAFPISADDIMLLLNNYHIKCQKQWNKDKGQGLPKPLAIERVSQFKNKVIVETSKCKKCGKLPVMTNWQNTDLSHIVKVQCEPCKITLVSSNYINCKDLTLRQTMDFMQSKWNESNQEG